MSVSFAEFRLTKRGSNLVGGVYVEIEESYGTNAMSWNNSPSIPTNAYIGTTGAMRGLVGLDGYDPNYRRAVLYLAADNLIASQYVRGSGLLLYATLVLPTALIGDLRTGRGDGTVYRAWNPEFEGEIRWECIIAGENP